MFQSNFLKTHLPLYVSMLSIIQDEPCEKWCRNQKECSQSNYSAKYLNDNKRSLCLPFFQSQNNCIHACFTRFGGLICAFLRASQPESVVHVFCNADNSSMILFAYQHRSISSTIWTDPPYGRHGISRNAVPRLRTWTTRTA